MKLVSSLEKKNILVIGDVMLDTYYDGELKRISPEAPVPVFRKKNERSVLGGAANVAANLVAAGQRVSIMAIIGNDTNGQQLISSFQEKGIGTDLLMVLERHTTQKLRFLADNNQQVLRLDIENTEDISHSDCKKMLNLLHTRIKDFDLILLSDYLKGLLSVEFTQGVLQMAKGKGIPAFIDVKDPNIEKYKDAYLLKPNKKELHNLTGLPVDDDNEIIKAAETLRKRCDVKYVLATCGTRGMVLVGEKDPYFVGSVGKEVFDVTGAGDTTIAYLAACMVNGMAIKDAVDVANVAAGIQVSKAGTSTVFWSEIRDVITYSTKEIEHKILENVELENFRNQHIGKKIVFTNGCFDILHIGHVRYLQEASKLGDILIVGVNSNASVKRLKGPERPINGEKDRAELLSAFGFINYVTIFDEDTPYELIQKLRPDVLVKGGDYKPEEVVGKDIVEAQGGELVLIPFVEDKSTTNIIRKVEAQCIK